ncbi:hypothetical protein TRVL_10287 [Trypanosoma vivax]|nr:hypothetical protein TRVL_10287 [Trypanosoma vivax]
MLFRFGLLACARYSHSSVHIATAFSTRHAFRGSCVKNVAVFRPNTRGTATASGVSKRNKGWRCFAHPQTFCPAERRRFVAGKRCSLRALHHRGRCTQHCYGLKGYITTTFQRSVFSQFLFSSLRLSFSSFRLTLFYCKAAMASVYGACLSFIFVSTVIVGATTTAMLQPCSWVEATHGCVGSDNKNEEDIKEEKVWNQTKGGWEDRDTFLREHNASEEERRARREKEREEQREKERKQESQRHKEVLTESVGATALPKEERPNTKTRGQERVKSGDVGGISGGAAPAKKESDMTVHESGSVAARWAVLPLWVFYPFHLVG